MGTRKTKTSDKTKTAKPEVTPEVPETDEALKTAQVATPEETEVTETTETQDAVKTTTPKKAGRVRSNKYLAVRAKVDKTKALAPTAAIELVKKLNYTKFDATITAHVVVKEAGTTATFAFPHSTGRQVKVAIASDELIEQIAAGKIDFDVLLSTPQYVAKLAKYAPILGPKGLMPNPKNGTITKDVETAKKRLEAGTLTVKTEKKAALMHINIGKVSMDTEKLEANLAALIKALTGKLVKLTIAASMSPGVKVELAHSDLV